MKPNTFLFLLPLAFLAAGCQGDEIVVFDKVQGETPESSTLSVPEDPDLQWSESSCVAILGETNAFPVLSNPYGLTVSYASGNESVATVSSDGAVTLLSVGTALITASAEATADHDAASATYTLIVTGGTDDGAGDFTFASTSDPSSDDDISNTTFTRLVTISFGGSEAAVTGDVYHTVSVNGNQVTVTNNDEDQIVIYQLSGSTSNGFFKLYSVRKQAVILNGVSITNPSGAALNIQSGKRTFVVLQGENRLSDSHSAAYTAPDDEDMKGVFFSEGQLVLSGSGSLAVTASNQKEKSALVSDDYVRVMPGPTLSVSAGSSAGHGIRGKDCVRLSGGILNVSTSAAGKKGIGSDDFVLVEGGTHTITVSGGVVYDSDDAEYKGSAGIKADNCFGMTGGTVTITNTGSGGKGVSAGSYDFDAKTHAVSDSYVCGGTLTVTTSGGESIDVSSKGIKIGYKYGSGRSYTYAGNLRISGGSVIVNCSRSEAVEAKGTLTVSGGSVYAVSSADDAINCQGDMVITGGYVYANSSQNDAMDANGDMTLSGGYVFALTTKGAPEVAMDANTEENHKLYINSGATVVAYGGLESGYSASQTVYSMNCSAGDWNGLSDGNSFVAAFKAPSGVSSVAVSAPSLSAGYTGVSVGGPVYCTGIWAASGISGGTAANLSGYSGGSGGPGGNQGGPGGGPGRR